MNLRPTDALMLTVGEVGDMRQWMMPKRKEADELGEFGA